MAKNTGNFKKGAIEMLLLALLMDGDCYGYELTQTILQNSDHAIIIPEGSMYPALYRLLEDGCISDEKRQVGKRKTRIYYHIEKKGVERLDALLDEYYEAKDGIEKVLKSTTNKSEKMR